MLFGRRKLLFEADEEDAGSFSASSEPEDGSENKSDNNSQSEEGDTKDEENTEDNTDGEDTQEDGDGEDNGESNEDNDDFSIDADGDGEGADDGDSSDDSSSSEEEEVNNEDTKRDKEIFDSLSPQEQKLKTTKLNELYLELYSNCNYIIEKINSISTPYEDLNIQIKKTLSILFNLKQMVSDYITNLFESKSYMENDINFNRYLSILNSVKGIVNDINKSIGEDETENK